jgi:hypothetical protein
MKKIRPLREVLDEVVQSATKTALLEALAQSRNKAGLRLEIVRRVRRDF